MFTQDGKANCSTVILFWMDMVTDHACMLIQEIDLCHVFLCLSNTVQSHTSR